MGPQRNLKLYDKDSEVDIQSRFLPHWFQPGIAVFVTVRTIDSMPRDVVQKWQNELRQWLGNTGIAFNAHGPLPDVSAIPDRFQSEFRKQRDRLWQWQLDSCHGACILRQREFAEIVLQSLLHFNGDRYDLASAIIMPNHVHLIAQFYPPITCRQQCTSWMHYTARIINRQTGSKGAFWQSEPFDHLIRSEAQFHYLQQYIAENGNKANLPKTDFLHWIDPVYEK